MVLVYNPSPPPIFDLKLVYFYVIIVANSESNLGVFITALVSKILLFLKIKMKKT